MPAFAMCELATDAPNPVDEFRQTVAFILRHGARRILSLAAFAMRRDDQALRDLIRDSWRRQSRRTRCSSMSNPSSGAGRGEHLSRIDIEELGSTVTVG